MERLVLPEQDVFPSVEILSKVLGEKIDLNKKTLDYIRIEFPECDPGRNFGVGENWLLKVLYQNKTLCWMFVYEEGPKATFYINGRYEYYLVESRLPVELKRQGLLAERRKQASLP